MGYDNYKHSDLTEKIIKAFFNVYNNLGHGFLEKVYENAMIIELTKMGLSVEQQQRINVFYGGAIVGDYYADLIVNEKIIVELKVSESICEEHEYQ